MSVGWTILVGVVGGFVIAQVVGAQEVRRAQFRPLDEPRFEIIRQFYAYDRELPLAARVVERHELEGAVLEKVVFNATREERIPGYLTLPKSARPPFACVLLLHGLNDSKEWWWRDDRTRSFLDSLTAAGIAFFRIDLRYHGERAAANDYQAPMYLTFENTLFIRSRDMMIQSAIDARRALDYLKTRSELDSTRFAVAGYSMGGMLALGLAVLEPWLAGWVGCAVPSHQQQLPADHYQFAARVRIPGLLLAGRQDWHSSEVDARKLLSLIRNTDKNLILYDSGHRLPPEFAGAAFRWLVDRLR